MDVVVEDNSISWGLIIFFVIIFIIIILLIVFEVFSFSSTTSGLNQACGTCAAGLVCQNGICKSTINGTCNTLSDCISSATSCTNNRCTSTVLSGVGGPAPCRMGLVSENGICKVPNSGSCGVSTDCLTNSTCVNSICVAGGTSGTSNNNSGNSNNNCGCSNNNSSRNTLSNSSSSSSSSSSNCSECSSYSDSNNDDEISNKLRDMSSNYESVQKKNKHKKR